MNTKQLLLSAFVIVALLLSPKVGSAQFVNGNVYLGPHLGFGSYGDVNLGANIEVPITSPGSAGPGRIALAGRVDIFLYTGGNGFLFSGIGNYHYSLAEDKVDLFGGLGISFFTFSNTFYGGTSSPFLAMDLGARYFLSSGFALRAMLGLVHYPWFTAGIDWAL